MAQGIRGEPLIILLIEDNEAHAELIRRNLIDHNVANEIIHLADGEQALDYLYRRGKYKNPKISPRPHVVLLDLRLPKIDGIEVLRQVKEDEKLRQIPVVVLTTSSAERDITEAYVNHANSYLVKPVDFTKFTEMMRMLGFYWLGWNTLPWSD